MFSLIIGYFLRLGLYCNKSAFPTKYGREVRSNSIAAGQTMPGCTRFVEECGSIRFIDLVLDFCTVSPCWVARFVEFLTPFPERDRGVSIKKCPSHHLPAVYLSWERAAEIPRINCAMLRACRRSPRIVLVLVHLLSSLSAARAVWSGECGSHHICYRHVSPLKL